MAKKKPSPFIDTEFEDLEEEEKTLELISEEAKEFKELMEETERLTETKTVEERVLDYYFDTGYVWFTVIPAKLEEKELEEEEAKEEEEV